MYLSAPRAAFSTFKSLVCCLGGVGAWGVVVFVFVGVLIVGVLWTVVWFCFYFLCRGARCLYLDLFLFFVLGSALVVFLYFCLAILAFGLALQRFGFRCQVLCYCLCFGVLVVWLVLRFVFCVLYIQEF